MSISMKLATAKRVVVKVGSRLLAENVAERTSALARQIAVLRSRGVEVVLVSSGAIALGVGRLGLPERPRDIPLLQATAAVGQVHLLWHYDQAFSGQGLRIGQVLLTHEDLSSRTRFLNARHALGALLGYGVVPIINENDLVAVEEIKFGDNDQLAALVTNLVEADALVILTDVQGLLDRAGAVVTEVTDVDAQALPLIGVVPSKDRIGSGGMGSKVEAARRAGRFGVTTVLAPGGLDDVLPRLFAGEQIGTCFVPPPDRALASRKHWIAFAVKPQGALVVDAGAVSALSHGKRSLLPSGIVEVRGTFSMGEAVSVIGPDGREFARGLAGYSADEIGRIRGKKSSDIESVLGYRYFDEVIHRDDLVML